MKALKVALTLGAAAALFATGSTAASATAVVTGVTLTPSSDGVGGYSTDIPGKSFKPGSSFDLLYTVVAPFTGLAQISAGVSGGTLTSVLFNGATYTLGANSETGVLTAGKSYSLELMGTTTSGGRLTGSVSMIAAVPEPATWAMMIGGVGIAGGALRRRTKRDTGKLALA